MDFFEKIDKAPDEDLAWNIPEQKRGKINIIGGSVGNFRTEIKVAEFAASFYPLEAVNVVLPDVLKKNLPPLPNFIFLPSTDKGTFAESQELMDIFGAADCNLVLGDLSKNAITGRAVASACKSSDTGGAGKLTLLTRDTVDVVSENSPERLLMNENLILLASMPQLIKLLRAVYYPKMLLLSQSLIQVAEVLHKFTLSFPVTIVTLHSEQILVASSGVVKAVALEQSGYSPLTLWNGELAAKILGMNLYNPGRLMGATVGAAFAREK